MAEFCQTAIIRPSRARAATEECLFGAFQIFRLFPNSLQRALPAKALALGRGFLQDAPNPGGSKARAMKPIALDHPITATEYHRLGEEGFFEDGERVELLEGEIVPMNPIGLGHAARVKRASFAFLPLFARRSVIVSVQDPIALDNLSEPEPDLALLKFRADFYLEAMPTPRDIFLVVEVADTTLRRDREEKIPLYGMRGIRESWLIDLNSEIVYIYRTPSAKGYLDSRVARRGDKIAPEAFPDFEISVDDLLG
jgi:Uma2 family endonuclease